MGSGASIEYYPIELQDLNNTINEITLKLIDNDINQLLIQKNKLIKDHKVIINILLTKDKQYLLKLLNKYEEIKDKNNNKRNFYNDIIKMLGGQYGEFIYKLTLSLSSCIDSVIDNCFSKYGANELLLADLICLCTPNELKELIEVYHINRPQLPTLKEVINSKSIGGLPFWEFLELLMIVERRTDDTADKSLSIKYMNDLYKAGLGNDKNDKNDEIILSIFAVMSRKQCKYVSDAFKEHHQINLSDAIHLSYGGSAQRALLIWTLPISKAILLCFQSIMTINDELNQTILLSYLSRYNRQILNQISLNLQSKYHLNLNDYIHKTFKGNLQHSIETWLNQSLCYDNGINQEILDFISVDNRSLYSISQDSKLLEDFQELLYKQYEKLSSYAKGAGITLPSYDITKYVPNNNSNSNNNNESQSECLQYISSLKECLEDQFILLDTELNEYLDEQIFWNYLISIQVGYREEDISDLKSWTSWINNDGTVHYQEILSDLTQNILRTMEYNGINIETKINELWKYFEEQAENQWNSSGYQGEFNRENDSYPPSLEIYLKKFLPLQEKYEKEYFFKKIEELIRIPLKEMNSIKSLWDEKKMDSNVIDWNDAIQNIQQLFPLIEYNETNYWIYLIEAESKKMYWYNLVDGSSSWMSQEDQQYYQSNLTHLVPANKTIAKVRRASLLQSAQFRRTMSHESTSLAQLNEE